MSLERTLALIKPDALRRGVIGKIADRLESSGLKPIAVRLLQLSPPQAEAFYAVHRERPFYPSLVKFMTSGPIVALVLEGENAVAQYREVMGATDPARAAAGTLRKDFATDVEQNAVHGSDSKDNAAKEIAFFFSHTEIHPYDWHLG